MNILVIGSGGREATLIWKIAQSKLTDKLYAVPGNPGMEQWAKCLKGDINDITAMVKLAQQYNIDLVVVGPEVPLTAGLIDALNQVGIEAFGPVKAAARLEGSKDFAKSLMFKYGIPTAGYKTFTNCDKAKAYIKTQHPPIVIKADGLAAGKGVIIAETETEAMEAVEQIMQEAVFGTAGSAVVIEEFMQGEEASILAFTDGITIKPMIPSQDHKRAYDNDKGPNTGGMGTYAPAPVITPTIMQEVQNRILQPIIDGLRAEGINYQGCLYAGLMITKEGPKVVEFNARFGDPETQVILPLLETDIVELMLACIRGQLKDIDIVWSTDAAVCVVVCAGGYPGKYTKGELITGIDAVEREGLWVFHAGTKYDSEGQLVTNGGRVLGVVGTGADIAEAQTKVYRHIDKLNFAGKRYRRDIANRALR